MKRSYLTDRNLWLIRGLPGSGKSTAARWIADGHNNGYHFETDEYFRTEGRTREYKFDPSKLKEAHEWCQNQVEEEMKYHGDAFRVCITVSNTFTQEWEMEAYYKLAKKYDYNVISLIVENRHGGENQHGVPKESIDRMRERFETKL